MRTLLSRGLAQLIPRLRTYFECLGGRKVTVLRKKVSAGQPADLRARWDSWGCLGLVLAGISVVAVCLVAPRSAFGQSERQVENQLHSLPPTIGEPLTIKPLDMEDIDCVVAEWQPATRMPVLTLICPPNAVFSPMRVLIKFSWLKLSDIPAHPDYILASAGTSTKIRTTKTAVQIWLPLDNKGKGDARQSWISFNAVVDVALLRGHPTAK